MGLRVADPLFDDLHRRDVELDVRRRRAAADAREPARLGEVRGERAGLRGLELLQRRRLERQQQALRLGRRPDRRRSPAWSLRFSPTAGWSSSTSTSRIVRCSAGPDPGEHQQLRRVVGAAAEDHLALGAELLHLPELRGRRRRPRACPRTGPGGRACAASRSGSAAPSPGAGRRPRRCARIPPRWVTWYIPTPSCSAPLKSSLRGEAGLDARLDEGRRRS